MRQLYLVCVKCKHIKFMSEAPSALSLCFKLGIYKYIFLSSFHLDFVENLRSSQVEKKKYSGATFYSMTSCLLCFSLWSWLSDVKIISSSPFAFFFPSLSTVPSWWSSIVFKVEPQCQTLKIINMAVGKYILWLRIKLL